MRGRSEGSEGEKGDGVRLRGVCEGDGACR